METGMKHEDLRKKHLPVRVKLEWAQPNWHCRKNKAALCRAFKVKQKNGQVIPKLANNFWSTWQKEEPWLLG